MPPVPDRSIRICADRGGTFCDVHASYPDPDKSGERKEIVVKLCESNLIAILRATYRSWYTVSQDKANYDDAPTEGIRRVLEIVEGRPIPRGTTLQTDKIGMSESNNIVRVIISSDQTIQCVYSRLHSPLYYCRY